MARRAKSTDRPYVCLQISCLLICLFYMLSFGANFVLLVIQQSWKDDVNNKEWVSNQFLDLVFSGISIIAAFSLLIALIKKNRDLLLFFLCWAVFCVISSIVILCLGLKKYKKEEIIIRCIGIVLTAIFIDIILSYYLRLKETRKKHGNTKRKSKVKEQESSSQEKIQDHKRRDSEIVEISEDDHVYVNNFCLWYEDTKL